MTQLKITAICGSLRTHSYSRVVLRSISKLLPNGTAFSEVNIGELPHYNEDLDGAQSPKSVQNARDLVSQSDAVILITPEFNHGLPGVLKNTLDWLSRPAFSSCFINKPVMFATISPGALGGVRAQYQLRETLASMLCQLYPLKEIVIPHIHNKIENDHLVDESTLSFMQSSIDSFLIQAGLSKELVG